MTNRIAPARPDVPEPALTRDGKTRQRAPRARRPVTITPAMLEGAPEFDPVPHRQIRYDGWTPDRQRAFIKALAETACVRRAAHAIGMSEVGAYQLRKAPGGEGFAQAWEEAQTICVAKLSDVALERAMHGVAVPVFRNGKQVGERRWYDNRLLTMMLRFHDPERYGGRIGHRVPPNVRKALYNEWERERSERDREHSKGAGRRLAARLEQLRARMIGPPGPGDSRASQLAWLLDPQDIENIRNPPAYTPEEAEEVINAMACRPVAEPEPEPTPPVPPRPARADSEADWADRDAARSFAERADLWAAGDPRDAEANAAAHWEAMVDAGRIGKREE